MDAPNHLSDEARRWWQSLCSEYDLEDEQARLLLQTSLEAFDRLRECQRQIARDGASILDRFGQTKSHPLLATERDARSQMMQSLKALNLDLEPLQSGPGRPPAA